MAYARNYAANDFGVAFSGDASLTAKIMQGVVIEDMTDRQQLEADIQQLAAACRTAGDNAIESSNLETQLKERVNHLRKEGSHLVISVGSARDCLDSFTNAQEASQSRQVDDLS